MQYLSFFALLSLLPFSLFTLSAYEHATPKTFKLNTLYNSLTPTSITENLAFYNLFPDTPEGTQALRNVLTHLTEPLKNPTPEPSPRIAHALTTLIHKEPMKEVPDISEEDLQAIFQLAVKLPNRKLKGHYALTNAEVLALLPEEIDLARGLFISQLGEGKESFHTIRVYEAILDLMALQILAVIKGLDATPQEKIDAMNHFIFEEMGFRFPPHSRYAKDIDLYTFLPSVLDSRRGVCLGVSILYISLAQRLNLSLEMITPPGHIYVRYKEGGKEINIETTARGVHVPSQDYLGINTRSLQERSIKEVIGLAHFNQASVFWQNGDHQMAIDSYHIAQKYLPEDPLLKELLGLNYFMIGDVEKAFSYLREVRDNLPESAVTKDYIAEEVLDGKADANAVNVVTQHVDETRESILKKKEELEKVIEKFPNFRTAHFQLAIAWLQLHREKEALERLKKVHDLNPNDATVEYYLSVLFLQRYDYQNAWKHFKIAHNLLRARDHDSKVLKELRKELVIAWPEPK